MRSLCILVVDDEPALARALGRLLERQGHEVHVAAGVTEARALTREVRPDVVLADLHLRDGSGAALLAELDAAHGDDQTLGLILTTGDEVVETAYPLLRKPYAPAALAAMLRRVVPWAA